MFFLYNILIWLNNLIIRKFWCRFLKTYIFVNEAQWIIIVTHCPRSLKIAFSINDAVGKRSKPFTRNAANKNCPLNRHVKSKARLFHYSPQLHFVRSLHCGMHAPAREKLLGAKWWSGQRARRFASFKRSPYTKIRTGLSNLKVNSKSPTPPWSDSAARVY